MLEAGYSLYESKANKFAFYYRKGAFGFGHAFEIDEVFKKGRPEKTLARVKHLAGNTWGFVKHKDGTREPRSEDKPYTMTWLIVRTDFYPSIQRAIDALTGKTEIPKGKRKPRPIESMTEDELNEWAKA
jgi:hypothetical protein